MPAKGILPKKYFIKTFGCQMNVSDSQRIASFLESQNFQIAPKIEIADLVIFNTCGVRQTAENSALGIIHNLKEKKPKIFIILTGCLAKRKDIQKKLENKVDFFCEIQNFNKLGSLLVKNQLKAENLKLKLFSQKKTSSHSSYLSIEPRYDNPQKALVPIMTGCNNFCSYCVVPYARGKEFSRPTKEIFLEIKKLSANDCQTITLLGQNVNSYAFEKNNFPTLLNSLAQTFPQITFKFLTSHPKDFSDQLIDVIASNPNIFKEIHLPIQSGSDRILARMNRPYTQKHYLSLIEKTRKKIPTVRFTTDVIVGFPGETQKDLEATADVLKKVGYSLVFINKYSPRPGTAAFKLKDSIPWEEKKRREKYLRQFVL